MIVRTGFDRLSVCHCGCRGSRCVLDIELRFLTNCGKVFRGYVGAAS